MLASGAFWFGVVIGYVTYRTLHHQEKSSVGDIAAVIGAIGGAVILKMFPAAGSTFNEYAIGLAAGFFGYLIISLCLGLVVGTEKAKDFLSRGGTTGGDRTGKF